MFLIASAWRYFALASAQRPLACRALPCAYQSRAKAISDAEGAAQAGGAKNASQTKSATLAQAGGEARRNGTNETNKGLERRLGGTHV